MNFEVVFFALFGSVVAYLIYSIIRSNRAIHSVSDFVAPGVLDWQLWLLIVRGLGRRFNGQPGDWRPRGARDDNAHIGLG